MIEIKETTWYVVSAGIFAVFGIGHFVLKPLKSVEFANAVVASLMLLVAIQELHHVHLVKNPRVEYLEKSGEQQ